MLKITELVQCNSLSAGGSPVPLMMMLFISIQYQYKFEGTMRGLSITDPTSFLESAFGIETRCQPSVRQSYGRARFSHILSMMMGLKATITEDGEPHWACTPLLLGTATAT
jgi:hypothetical protein